MAQKIDKGAYVATNALFFTVLNLVKVRPYAAAGLITRETLALDHQPLHLLLTDGRGLPPAGVSTRRATASATSRGSGAPGLLSISPNPA